MASTTVATRDWGIKVTLYTPREIKVFNALQVEVVDNRIEFTLDGGGILKSSLPFLISIYSKK
jgi:hypothetical protein